MNPFIKLKVSHRLYLMYGIVMLFSLAFYVLVMLSLSGLERTNMQVFDREAEARILTQVITTDLNMVSRLSRNIMLGADFEKNLADIRALEQSISANFDHLPATLSSPDEQRLAESSRTATLAFIKVVLSMMEESRALPPEQRHTLFERYERDATPPAQASRKSFGELSTLAERHYHEATTTAKQQYADLVTTLNTAMPIYAVILTLILLIIVRSITRPLNELIVTLADISQGDGDLTRRLMVHDEHEFGRVAQGFNAFTDSLRQLIVEMHHYSSDAVSAAFHLEHDSEGARLRVAQSADQMTGVAAASEEMTATTESIAKNCSQAADRAREASRIASQGAEVVRRTIDTMQILAERVQASAETVQELGGRSDQIGAIVGAIKAIADQTNLLALNAAIEAARAGEQGRGFAVVADEVRALAGRTNQATREIGDMIQAIQQETTRAVASMRQGVAEVEQGSAAAASSGDALVDILSSADAVTQEIDQIATAAEELAATNNDVARNLQQISELTQRSLEQSRRAETTAGQMIGTFQALQTSLSQFKSQDDLCAILYKAKIAHLVFVRNIKRHLRGEAQLDARTLPTHRACTFGLWYAGDGLERFRDNAVFREIDTHHQRVHELAKQAAQSADAGARSQAEGYYQEMASESARLQVLLDELREWPGIAPP